VDRLTLLGYEDCGGVVGRRYLRRRDGRQFNVQIMEVAGPQWEENLLFRDYLRLRPDVARRYSEAKWAAAEAAPMLLAYSELKSPIIEELLRLARSTVPSDSGKRTVQQGYDEIAERYLTWGGRVQGDPRDRLLEAFAQRLPDGARVLDLGCGAGLPSTKQLARRFEVVGVDISDVQLRLARQNVPNATFMRGDIAQLELSEGSFDGIAALYSISHIPRDEHEALFVRIACWLRPGGLLLASLGATGHPDWTGEWLGVPMFFSSHDADTNRRLLRDAGLTLVIDEVVSMQEPEGEATFLWVLAKKPAP